MRRPGGSARVGNHLARHPLQARERPEPEVGRLPYLYELRKVRTGLPHRSARRERLRRRRDGQAHRQPQFARTAQRGAGMKKVKVATAWLDGCSGCHMSLLDMDAAIISLAQKIDLVYGQAVKTYNLSRR